MDIREERLTGVGLCALQEAQGGEIDEPGRQTSIAQGPDRLGNAQSFWRWCHTPLITTVSALAGARFRMYSAVNRDVMHSRRSGL